MPNQYVFHFSDIIDDDVSHVGEKAVVYSQLYRAGIPIPNGFTITTYAYDNFLKENNLHTKTKHLISTANHSDPNSVNQVSSHIKKYFNEGNLSSKFNMELYSAYKKLSGKFTDSHVKILLSPISESHLKQHPKIHNIVKGEASLIHSIKNLWSDNFSEINLINNENMPAAKSIIVQKVINSDKSGKIYTIDPANYDKNKIIIKSMLGEYENQENLQQPADYYEFEKITNSVISKEEIPQVKMKKRIGTIEKTIKVPFNLKNKKKLTKNEIDELIKFAKMLEKISYFPQEIDWSIEHGKLYFTHTKPLINVN